MAATIELKLFGHEQANRFVPYLLHESDGIPRRPMTVVDALGSVHRQGLAHHLTHGSVFQNFGPPWIRPKTQRWYYLLQFEHLDGQVPEIETVEDRLRRRPPRPVRPGDLQLATPQELLFVTADWSFDRGIIYRHFLPIAALGGRNRSHKERRTNRGRQHRRVYYWLDWKTDKDSAIVFKASQGPLFDVLLEGGTILVRSRRRLPLGRVRARSAGS